MKIKNSLLKIGSIVSTVLLIAASIVPDTLRVPVPMRPWIFLLAIVWVLLMVSGVFSS